MKKSALFILLIVLLGGAFIGVSQTFAQDTTPPIPPSDGEGIGPRRFGRGTPGSGEGFLHEYMSEALAEEFGISLEKLNDLHEEGSTLWDYAQDLNLTVEEFRSKMAAARQAALLKAAEDGVISQDQAEWMADRMENFGGGDHLPGFGPCHDGKFEGSKPMHGRRGGRGMGRW